MGSRAGTQTQPPQCGMQASQAAPNAHPALLLFYCPCLASLVSRVGWDMCIVDVMLSPVPECPTTRRAGEEEDRKEEAISIPARVKNTLHRRVGDHRHTSHSSGLNLSQLNFPFTGSPKWPWKLQCRQTQGEVGVERVA